MALCREVGKIAPINKGQLLGSMGRMGCRSAGEGGRRAGGKRGWHMVRTMCTGCYALQYQLTYPLCLLEPAPAKELAQVCGDPLVIGRLMGK